MLCTLAVCTTFDSFYVDFTYGVYKFISDIYMYIFMCMIHKAMGVTRGLPCAAEINK